MQLWRNYLLGSLAVLATPLSVQAAIAITASNDWTSCQLQDIVTDAGTYYSGTLASGSSPLTCGNAYVTISGAASSTTNWTLEARLTAPVSGLNISLMRTGTGTGDSTPAGGDSYITQSTAFNTLFTGQGNISSIPLQFAIDNFDVTDGNGLNNIQIEYLITTN